MASNNERNFDHVYELVKLDQPSPESIKLLLRAADAPSALAAGTPAAPGPGSRPGWKKDLPLAQGLWVATSLLAAAAKPTDSIPIYVWTDDDEPCAGGAGEVGLRVRDAFEQGQDVVVVPLQPGGGRPSFDPRKFWDAAVGVSPPVEAAGAGAPPPPPPPPVRGGTVGAGSVLPASDGDWSNVSDSVLRKAGKKKRSVGTVPLQLAPGVTLSVSLFHDILSAKKPTAVRVLATTGERVVSGAVHTDAVTGERVEPHSMLRTAVVGGANIFFSVEEAAALRRLPLEGTGGLTLMGFKPLSAVSPIDNLSAPVFVYPSDRVVAGSTSAYTALLARCLARGVAPICRFQPRVGGVLRFVALWPVREVLRPDGSQDRPAGFYAVLQPFADDFRGVRLDSSDTAKMEARDQIEPSEVSVAAACTMVNAVARATPRFAGYSHSISTPVLDKFYAGLEASALQTPFEWDDLRNDACRPQNARIVAEAGGEIDSFVASSGISAPDVKLGGGGGAGTKRKAAAADLDEGGVAAIDWKAEWEAGRLEKHTVVELKTYTRAHDLGVPARKPELIALVAAHLEKLHGGAGEEGGAGGEGPLPTPAEVREMGSGALKKLLKSQGVDYSGCVEKGELLALALTAVGE